MRLEKSVLRLEPHDPNNLDKNKNGTLSMEEFQGAMDLMQKMRGAAKPAAAAAVVKPAAAPSALDDDLNFDDDFATDLDDGSVATLTL